ncbi:hypothetical protein FHR47_001604 [Xanthomonas arboricola]|nr:hypothetical protein [Xanthomonas cannabis]
MTRTQRVPVSPAKGIAAHGWNTGMVPMPR